MAERMPDIPKIRKRGDFYYITWWDAESGRSRRRSLDTKDADEARVRYRLALESGIFTTARRKEGMTVEAALRAYFHEHVRAPLPGDPDELVQLTPRKSRDAGPVAKERIAFAAINILAGMGRERLADLDERAFEKYADARNAGRVGRKKGSDATVRREISTLRAAVNHQIAKRRLATDEAPIWWLPEAPEPRCDKFLPLADLKRLATAGSDRLHRFVMLGYYTAARKGAIETLSWDQVDFDNGVIDLHPPGRRRTKKRNPVVPIATALRPLLEDWWLDAEHDQVIGPGSIRAAWSVGVKAAGLKDRGVTPHWLRHSRATHLLQDGRSLWEVAGLLGDTVETVERTYGHHCPHHLKSVVG